MTYAYPQYWRDMVKHGINCTDEYADILLKYAETHSNGIDTSEAEWDELRELGDRYRKLEQQCREKSQMWTKLRTVTKTDQA